MTTNTPSEPAIDFALSGFNVRCNRMARGKTQAELADRAGVSRTTVRRLESGQPIHFNSLQKICAALNRPVDMITAVMTYREPGEPSEVHVCRKAELKWFAGGDLRKKAPKDNQRLLQSEEERLRLARLGLVGYFEANMVALPYGPSNSISEICERVQIGPENTFSDCVLYCLRGEAVVTVGEESYRIAEGDSIGFSILGPASIEPATPIGASDLPPLILIVMANRKGHVPILYNQTQRKRIRHSARLSASR